MLYAIALTLHSWLRWLVLLGGLFAFVRAGAGAAGRRPWQSTDDRAGFWFTMLIDAQMLVGLILYFFLSPLTHSAFGDFGAAMKSSPLRFWAVEHTAGMLIGVALVHVGRVRVRKADPSRRHRIAAIFFGLALAVILASIPWPGSPNGRPLLRW
jgi:hypothetical protein